MDTTRNQSFSLQWKSNESTKHYLIQMLLVINWPYWQAVQAHLMEAHFIEIHQVYKKKSDTFLTELYINMHIRKLSEERRKYRIR